MMRIILNLICLVAIVMISGCMGYQLGGNRPAGIETVAMAPVINKTTEPAIELQVTHALRDRIQFDGRFKLINSTDDADGIIEVTLTQFSMDPIAFRSERQTTPQLYRMRITGTAKLKNAKTGETIAESENYGEATFPFESDLTSTKRDALPVAAAEIAKFMIDDLIERW